jgi:predicted deacetylase
VNDRDDDRASFAQPERKNVEEPALLVALHDVTPAHAARLARAEQLLSALGLTSVVYLYVPDFHGRGAAHADAQFAAWCRAPRPYRVDWFLHGYFHEERQRDRQGQPATPVDWFARRFLTDGEGEFLGLRGRALQERVQTGIQSMARAVGRLPAGFVAPAWLYNDDLLPVLQQLGVRFAESHFHVFDLQAQEAIAAPVITWASRTHLHRLSSRVCASVERRLWRGKPLVRVALHPADFDHPGIVASIARTIGALKTGRRVIGCQELAAYNRSRSTMARLVQTPKLK